MTELKKGCTYYLFQPSIGRCCYTGCPELGDYVECSFRSSTQTTNQEEGRMKTELEIREELQKLREFVSQVSDEELKQRHIHYIDQLEWVLKEAESR